MDTRTPAKVRRNNDFYNVVETAEILGINRNTYNKWIDLKVVPAPSHKYDKDLPRFYYKSEEIEAIKQIIKGE